MAGRRAEKDEEAVLVDTNVVISALLRQGSFTRRVIAVILLIDVPLYHPARLLDELERHFLELIRRKGLNEEKAKQFLNVILTGIRPLDKSLYEEFIEEAKLLVRDLDDAEFVAAALYPRRLYERVILLTWNKKDYKAETLARKDIMVLTPSEYMRIIREKTSQTPS